MAEAEILRGVFGVPGDLFGQGVLGVEVEVTVQAVLLEGYVLNQADAVPQAASLAGIDMIDVDPHAFVQRQGLGHDGRRVFAALFRDAAEQLDAGDYAAGAVHREAVSAVVGVFLKCLVGVHLLDIYAAGAKKGIGKGRRGRGEQRSCSYRAASAIMTGMTDAPKPRWFHPTPGWLIVGLLAVEGLLWLSERFQWFWFNEKKGWTVLIAVASVAVVFAGMLLWLVVALAFSVAVPILDSVAVGADRGRGDCVQLAGGGDEGGEGTGGGGGGSYEEGKGIRVVQF